MITKNDIEIRFCKGCSLKCIASDCECTCHEPIVKCSKIADELESLLKYPIQGWELVDNLNNLIKTLCGEK